MKTTFLIFFFGFNSLFVFGQKIALDEVIADFEFLNEAVLNAHGVNYDPENKIDISTVLETLDKLDTDSITVMDFRYYLGKALTEIGCMHTSVKEFPLKSKMKKIGYFPIKIWLYQDQIVLGNQKRKTFKKYEGKVVKSINQIEASYFVERLKNYFGGDGSGAGVESEYQNEIGNIYTPLLIPFFLNYPDTFNVVTTHGDFNCILSQKPNYQYRTSLPINKLPQLFVTEYSSFLMRDSIPVLRIEKFKKEDRKFWPKVFDQLDAENESPYLVIDLRGNGGGNRAAGCELMRFLSQEEFQYEILQPKQKPKKYLNKKGKRYYNFSKYKYNTQQFYRKTKTTLGKSFVYKYKPHKTVYQGQIIVMTDGFTASTSTMLTTWLKKHTNAVFIGRTCGGGYNGNNGGAFPRITLPHSQTVIKFPSYRLILDRDSDHNGGLKPDIEVIYSVQDWLDQKDKDWEAVLSYILSQK